MANKAPVTKFAFDATNVAPQQPLEPVPTDWYKVKIVESSYEPTKDTTGNRLRLIWEIVEGDFKGRRIFDGLNVKNKSADAQRIGQAQLSAVCHAVGVIKFNDSKELHNKIMEIRAVYKDAADGYDAGNDVKGYRPAEGVVNAVAGNAAAAAASKWKKPAAVETPAAEESGAAAEPAGTEGIVDLDTMGFYLYVEGANVEMTGAEVRAALAEGMPEDTPICVDTESDKGWKTIEELGFLAKPEEPAAPAAPPAPPAGKKGPAAPAKAAATPAKASPPWLQKKK